ncbi:MAG: hypothetical protein ACRCZF_19190, partial [Gemmataceae bacterium]
FQGYRPDGDGVEEVFQGMPDAPEYVERIRLVCLYGHILKGGAASQALRRYPPLRRPRECPQAPAELAVR